MNKELVEVRESPDPPYAERTDGWAGPDPRDEPGEVVALGQPGSTLLGESLEGARQDNAGPSNEIAFSQHEMGGEIVGGPAVEQGRNRRAEFIEEGTKPKSFLRV
jgi:hypothetical protein